MASVYNPTAVQFGTSVTLPSDGDSASAASVNAPIQALSDGVTFLNPVYAAVMSPLADLTALAAILAPADGTIRHVLGAGLYVFKTSATSGLSPFRVAATDGTPGGWRASEPFESSVTRYLTLNGSIRVSASAGAIAPVLAATGLSAAINYGNPSMAQAQFGPEGFYPTVVYNAGAGSYVWSTPLDGFLIDGATLASATLYFRPVGGHAGVPTVQPWVGIVRQVRTGYNPVPTRLKSGATGYTQLAAANVAAYQVDQALVFTPDQNNVIDLATYSYVLAIGDEGAGNMLPGNRYAQVALAMTGIPDAGRRS